MDNVFNRITLLLTPPVRQMGIWGAVLLCAFTIYVVPAHAACSDPAAPGVDWQRCLRDERPFINVDLEGARLRSALFSRADLSQSNLANIDGRRAKFTSARLIETILDGADLREADFTKAELDGASFKEARLRQARFYHASLRNVDFTGADLDGVDFTRADLSGALWTDGKHRCAENSIGQCK